MSWIMDYNDDMGMPRNTPLLLPFEIILEDLECKDINMTLYSSTVSS